MGARSVVGAGVVAWSLAVVPAASAAEFKLPRDCDGVDMSALTEVNVGTAERSVACLVNAARVAMGRRPLRLRASLSRAARRHARDMVERRYFAHRGPDGSTLSRRITAVKYAPDRIWSAGEALATGTDVLGSPQAVVVGWLMSPGHRRVVLGRRFRHMGIGVVAGLPDGPEPDGATYVLNVARVKRR